MATRKWSEKQIREVASHVGIPCDQLIDQMNEKYPVKSKKVPDECFSDFKEQWLKAFPQFKLEFNGASAKALNSIIHKCRQWLMAGEKDHSRERVNAMFAYSIAYIKRENHWVINKGLNVWDQKWIELLSEMFAGKKMKPLSTREKINQL